MYCGALFLVSYTVRIDNILILKSTLSYINISTPAILHLVTANYIFSYSGLSTCIFIKSILLELLYQSDNLCLFIGVFNIFTVEAIINLVGLRAPILVLIFYLFHLSFVSAPTFLPSVGCVAICQHFILCPGFSSTSLWFILVTVLGQWFLNLACIRNSWRFH